MFAYSRQFTGEKYITQTLRACFYKNNCKTDCDLRFRIMDPNE